LDFPSEVARPDSGPADCSHVISGCAYDFASILVICERLCTGTPSAHWEKSARAHPFRFEDLELQFVTSARKLGEMIDDIGILYASPFCIRHRNGLLDIGVLSQLCESTMRGTTKRSK
jgi:hypothetical protein